MLHTHDCTYSVEPLNRRNVPIAVEDIFEEFTDDVAAVGKALFTEIFSHKFNDRVAVLTFLFKDLIDKDVITKEQLIEFFTESVDVIGDCCAELLYCLFGERIITNDDVINEVLMRIRTDSDAISKAISNSITSRFRFYFKFKFIIIFFIIILNILIIFFFFFKKHLPALFFPNTFCVF